MRTDCGSEIAFVAGLKSESTDGRGLKIRGSAHVRCGYTMRLSLRAPIAAIIVALMAVTSL